MVQMFFPKFNRPLATTSGRKENLKICFQIRILRVNNTYLTYTMDFNPGRRSPGFQLALTSGEDFLPTHRAVSSSGKPHKDMSLPFRRIEVALGRTFEKEGLWVCCMLGRLLYNCLLLKF